VHREISVIWVEENSVEEEAISYCTCSTTYECPEWDNTSSLVCYFLTVNLFDILDLTDWRFQDECHILRLVPINKAWELCDRLVCGSFLLIREPYVVALSETNHDNWSLGISDKIEFQIGHRSANQCASLADCSPGSNVTRYKCI